MFLQAVSSPYDFENLNIGLQYNTQVPSFNFGPGFWFSITTLFIVVVLFIFGERYVTKLIKYTPL